MWQVAFRWLVVNPMTGAWLRTLRYGRVCRQCYAFPEDVVMRPLGSCPADGPGRPRTASLQGTDRTTAQGAVVLRRCDPSVTDKDHD